MWPNLFSTLGGDKQAKRKREKSVNSEDKHINLRGLLTVLLRSQVEWESNLIIREEYKIIRDTNKVRVFIYIYMTSI